MPNITRVSTMALQTRTISDFSRVQGQLADLQNQMSSGVKTKKFQGITGDVEQFTGLEGEIDKLQTLINNNTENISRFRTARNVVESIISVVDNMENFLTLRRNGAMENKMQFQQQMEDMRKNLTRELNATFGSRFLFGGTRTDTPPVMDEPIPSPAQIGVPDDSYYQGSKENLIVRPTKDYDIEFDVRADEEAFQKVMGAAAYALQADVEDDEDKIAESLQMMQDGLEGIIAIQARLDARLVTMEDINDRHEALKTHFTNVKESLINTDILSASTEVSINESILTATFQSFARINSLRLVDFLG